MVTVVAGDVIEVSLQAEFDDTEDVVSVYQFQVAYSGVVSEADWAADLINLIQQILAVKTALVSTWTVYKRFRARFVNKVDAGRLIELPAAVPGTGTGEASPAGVAILHVFRTAVPRMVLKKYVGTVAESAIGTNGKVNTATLALGALYMAKLLAPIAAPLNEYTYGHYDEVTTDFTIPTSGYVNAEPAYQRRRRRGHGS